jgi:hypothetical protein
MRLLTSLSMLALIAMAAPTMAQDTPAPATQAPATEAPVAPPAPPAAAPAPKTAAPEGVSDEIDKMLWCGHAFSEVSAQAKAGGDQNTANQMGPLGVQLIDRGSAELTKGGTDANRLAEIKVAYAKQINNELQGAGANAKFTFQDCISLVQPQAAPATPAAPAEPAAPPAAPAKP